MKNTKRLMLMNYNYYKEIEQKLELYAKKGLVLEKMGPYLWTFKKTEPQNLKYAVTYFVLPLRTLRNLKRTRKKSLKIFTNV